MFRLIKLVAYALLGYALYEFFVGLTSESYDKERPSRGEHARGRDQGGSRQGSSSAPRDEGMTVSSQGSDGGSASHAVGRGAVPR